METLENKTIGETTAVSVWSGFKPATLIYLIFYLPVIISNDANWVVFVLINVFVV